MKAIFLDYTGTIMQEESVYAIKMAQYIASHSDLKEITDIFAKWWELIKEMEHSSYGEDYRTEDELVIAALDVIKSRYHLTAEYLPFIEMAHQFWSKSPAFEDVKGFFEKSTLPIYIITNNGEEYVKVFLEDNQLECAGIICGDMVRAYKPHKELFEKALRESGCRPSEVIHIGDSLASDVKGASRAGIRPILLDRKGIINNAECDVIRELKYELIAPFI